MKTIMFALAMMAGFYANAVQVPKFKCTVPGKVSTVTADISVSDSEPMDYVTVDLNDKAKATLFMQMDKGNFQKQIDAGSITTLVLGDQFTQGDDGVIRDGGVLAIGLDNNVWKGLLSVKGNVYPLDCTKL